MLGVIWVSQVGSPGHQRWGLLNISGGIPWVSEMDLPEAGPIT